MGDADGFHRGAANKGLQALGLPPELESKRYGFRHTLPIHFCSQPLHLWVTASARDLVYRELIRKYFGTEIMTARKSIMAAGFSAEPGDVEALVTGVRQSECTSVLAAF
jgi:hypothetical protein